MLRQQYLNLFLLVVICTNGATALAPRVAQTRRSLYPSFSSFGSLFSSPIDEEDRFESEEDDEVVEPGKMRVSEIKAELDLREVPYIDCFDKDSLIFRLKEARDSGKADPKILETFNKQKIEQQFTEEKVEIKDQDIDAAVANDGTLPGGLTPDVFKKLTGNPELMSLLQSTKMQEAMSLMMTGGQGDLEEKMKEDPELKDVVEKLDGIMKSLQ